MIKTFADKATAAIFLGKFVRLMPHQIQIGAHGKLLILDAAVSLRDLRSPPANRLELLSGTRLGQHSLRINSQWRVCFLFKAGDAYDVEIVDYH
jgi:proteic killer suppression protein